MTGASGGAAPEDDDAGGTTQEVDLQDRKVDWMQILDVEPGVLEVPELEALEEVLGKAMSTPGQEALDMPDRGALGTQDREAPGAPGPQHVQRVEEGDEG